MKINLIISTLSTVISMVSTCDDIKASSGTPSDDDNVTIPIDHGDILIIKPPSDRPFDWLSWAELGQSTKWWWPLLLVGWPTITHSCQHSGCAPVFSFPRVSFLWCVWMMTVLAGRFRTRRPVYRRDAPLSVGVDKWLWKCKMAQSNAVTCMGGVSCKWQLVRSKLFGSDDDRFIQIRNRFQLLNKLGRWRFHSHGREALVQEMLQLD